MKYFFVSLCFLSSLAFAQNVIRVRAVLVPNTGTFTATSKETKGRLLKRAKEFTADRISVFVDSFKTENSLRDKHFKQHIGGGPKMTHPRVDITELKASHGKGRANLTLNGITKEVEIIYTEKPKFIEAHFNVNSTDFDLPKAQYLGIGVEPGVKVNVEYHYEIK